jgi:hypothetical protein
MSKTSVFQMADSKCRTAIHGTKRILAGLTLAAAYSLQLNAMAQSVPLGSDTNFAILAGAGITVAGAVNSSAITGNIGSYPTESVTGLGNVTLTGVNESASTDVMTSAKSDLTTAFNAAALAPATVSYATAQDLGGLTLFPGVYNEPSSFGLTGILTLDANGVANPVWIFQSGSTLITATSSEVLLTDGAQASDVFWEVGSSATLGSSSEFAGNVLASASITAGTGATVDGRLLAEVGAVTLDGSDTVTMPVAATGPGGGGTNPGGGGDGSAQDAGGTVLLFSIGLAALFAFRRRFSTVPRP